jgi:hypothetical protein
MSRGARCASRQRARARSALVNGGHSYRAEAEVEACGRADGRVAPPSGGVSRPRRRPGSSVRRAPGRPRGRGPPRASSFGRAVPRRSASPSATRRARPSRPRSSARGLSSSEASRSEPGSTAPSPPGESRSPPRRVGRAQPQRPETLRLRDAGDAGRVVGDFHTHATVGPTTPSTDDLQGWAEAAEALGRDTYVGLIVRSATWLPTRSS